MRKEYAVDKVDFEVKVVLGEDSLLHEGCDVIYVSKEDWCKYLRKLTQTRNCSSFFSDNILARDIYGPGYYHAAGRYPENGLVVWRRCVKVLKSVEDGILTYGIPCSRK